MTCDPWTTEAELTDCGCPSELASAANVTAAIAAASDWLHENTHHRFGVCTTTERPCRPCGCAMPAWCGCSGESVIELNRGPIVGTPTVTIDGVPFTAFTVLPPNRLVRTDSQTWPTAQSLTAGEGLEVTYDHGVAVPGLARLAASDLAIEILQSCAGQTCVLPSGATQVNRRGVSITLDAKTVGQSMPRVSMLLGVYGMGAAGLTRLDRTRGLITAGPA